MNAEESLENKIQDYSFFLSKVGKPIPDSGGGAVAAYSGSLATVLMLKVCRIETKNRSAGNIERVQWESLSLESTHLAEKFLELIQQDCQAYENWVLARNSSKYDEKPHAAFLETIHVPIQIVCATGQGLSLARTVVRDCKRRLTADVMVSVELYKSALRGAQRIAEANIRISDSNVGLRIVEKRLEQSVNEAWNIYQELVKAHPLDV